MKKHYFDQYDINVLSAMYYAGGQMSRWELHQVTGHSPTKILKVLNKLEKMNLVVKIRTNKKDRNNKIRYDWDINIDTFRRYFSIAEKNDSR